VVLDGPLSELGDDAPGDDDADAAPPGAGE
jgi:hypothetical protein